MALSRLTTWTGGDTLTASALNAEFNNILNNALSLISPLTADLDFDNHQAKNFEFERTTIPTSTSENRSRAVFNTADNTAYYGTVAAGNYIPFSGVQVSRVQGLQGSLISNVGSFAAEGTSPAPRGGQRWA